VTLTERWRGFYVYVYRDPRDGAVFYVGKGKGRRAWLHLSEAQTGTGHNLALSSRILLLQSLGTPPLVECVSQGLSEPDAFDMERLAIATHRGTAVNASEGCMSDAARRRSWARDYISRQPRFRAWVAKVRPSRLQIDMHLLLLKVAAQEFARPTPVWLSAPQQPMEGPTL
jgi:hypothetical protein